MPVPIVVLSVTLLGNGGFLFGMAASIMVVMADIIRARDARIGELGAELDQANRKIDCLKIALEEAVAWGRSQGRAD